MSLQRERHVRARTSAGTIRTRSMDEVLKANRKQSAGNGLRSITIRGAREHNLKGVDLELPRDKLVVFTGLSGSGKSSLALSLIHI